MRSAREKRISDYACLFLPANSPGAIFRFLERRRQRDSSGYFPPSLLLSDATGPQDLRLLRAEAEDTQEWMQGIGPLLSGLFPPHTFLMQRNANSWNFVIWQDNKEIERGGGSIPQERRRTLWELLPGARQTLSPDMLWAQEHGLPIHRLQAPVIEYETVARLDQKSLLVENSPRLYRFSL